ncbi:DciA family protein [Streptomyces sp. NPDC059679]|uniref:DciA family protein n=1 Tax=Streptomyces sp. NPDC059679 TaxID=3346903 RepID=UPI0036874D75
MSADETIRSSQSGTSGRDLARLALARYKAAAKNRPTTPPKKRAKRSQTHYGSGRDVIGLGSVIAQLSEDREWTTSVAGGNIFDRWPQWCPDLTDKAAPTTYDSDTQQLTLRPATAAAATHLRIIGAQLVTHLQQQGASVRTIQVLPPGPLPTPGAAPGSEIRKPAEEAPVKTRDDACPGYHQTLAAIDHTPPAGQKPRLQRDWGTGEYSWLREPEDRFTDAVVAIEAAEASRGNDPDAVRQAAIRMARAQKDGRVSATPTTFQRTA